MRSKAGALLITASLVLFVTILFIIGCSNIETTRYPSYVESKKMSIPQEMSFPEDWKALKPSPLVKKPDVNVAKMNSEKELDIEGAVDIGIFNADEIWVIVKPDQPAQPDEDIPTCGSMIAIDPHSKKEIALPLKHTDVKAGVSGYISTVNVKQEFVNPYDIKIEARYVFPLPQDAAVDDFLMTIGSRTIRGVIREKAQAKRIYERAKSQGHVASLLTQPPKTETIEKFFKKIYVPIGADKDLDLPLDEAVPDSKRWFTGGGLFIVKPSRQSWVGFVVTLAICLACVGVMVMLVVVLTMSAITTLSITVTFWFRSTLPAPRRGVVFNVTPPPT